MLKKEWQALWNNKFMIIVLIAIITIPTIYTNIFLGSMWDPYGEVDHLPVAVVNNDKAAEYDGKTMEVGKELVDNLKENNSLDFNFVDADTAASGLENGTYYMVITIPEDFSYNATTLMDESPKTMELKYDTNPGTNYIASKMSETAINKIRTTVAEKVTKQYAETLFDQLGTINDGFKDASDATETLDDGANKLKDGSTTLATNLETLSDSTLTFKDGTEKFNVSLGTYTSSVAKLDAGATKLKEGVDKLAGKTGTLSDGATQLNDGSATLKEGVKAYTDAVSQLYAGTTTLASKNKALNEGVGTLSSGLTTLKTGTSGALSGLKQMSSTLGESLSKENLSNINKLTAGLETAGDSLKEADTSLQKMDTATLNGMVTALGTGVSGIKDAAGTASEKISGVKDDADKAVDSIKASEGFSKLSSDEQKEILDAVKGITAGANYQQAAAYVSGIKTNAGEMQKQLAGADLSSLSKLDTLKTGIHTLVENDVLGNSKTVIEKQTAGLQSVKTVLDREGKTTDTMGLIQVMTAVNEGATKLESGVNSESGLKSSVKTYTGAVNTVNTNLGKLNEKSDTLASGAMKLNTAISGLASKVPTLTEAMGTLQGGLTTLTDGTGKLTANNGKLMEASNTIKDSSSKIADATDKLSDGAGTLEEKLGTLTDGTKELHETIADSSKELDEKLEPTGDKTYEMMSAPVDTDKTEASSVDNNGNAMAAYMMSVGLWVGCLAFSIMFSLDQPAGKVKNGISWWFSKASVGGLIALIQPIVMIFGLKKILGFNPVDLNKTVLVAVFASCAFMSLFYLFNVLMGKVGSFLLLVFMVLQLGGSAGTYPIELSNGFYQAINPYMPFTYSVNAFRSTIANGLSVTNALTVFAGIFVVATALTIGVFHIKAKRIKANDEVMDAEVVLE